MKRIAQPAIACTFALACLTGCGEDATSLGENPPECSSTNACGDGLVCISTRCVPTEPTPPKGTPIVINPIVPDGVDGYRYVLLEDLSRGGTRTVRADALSVTDARGEEHFATRVVVHESKIGAPVQDPDAILGPPDSACQELNRTFILGGVGGYVVVDFERIIRPGDVVTLYNVHNGTCPNRPELDQGYATMAVSRDPFSGFTELGQGSTGSIRVP